ncbi:hypothetical protein B296_00024244 [Ensete ventricosum]|uniref:Dilute domain-containing protein n=1 Tax=Ensete ventricosum TaxID=4639 RepID=A0A427AL28_ENSVE|nr:hypothetical protein B296_00024244 [Ensete ventricosum]
MIIKVINWNLMQKFYQMTNFKLQEPAAAPLAPDLSKQKYLADRQQSTRSSSSGMGISSGYSGMVGKSEDQSRIEAKYPAILFKQQLTAYVEKIYGMIRDSLKKEISPFLTLCIQVLHQKPNKSLKEISNEICPVSRKLNSGDKRYKVIANMRTMMTDDSITMPNNSFLLDDDSR